MEKTKTQVEILRFEAPDGTPERSIFISQLSNGVTTQMLRAIFLEFGAIHWVYLNETEPDSKGDTVVNYALIKYYSTFSAKDAVRHSGAIEILSRKPKISHPTRAYFGNKRDLSIGQCFELANYYLGFEGWCSSLRDTVRLERPPAEGLPGRGIEETFIFRTEVWIMVSGVEGLAKGVGYGYMNKFEDQKREDGTIGKVEVKSLDKATVIQRVKKMAVKNAYLNAFSKMVLILLSNGKVTAAFQEPPEEMHVVTTHDMLQAEGKIDVDAEFSAHYGEVRERPWVQ